VGAILVPFVRDLSQINAGGAFMKKAVLSVVLLLGVSLLFSTPVESQKNPRARVVVPETGITFVLISPGRFQMGSPDNEPARAKDERQHWRTIKEPFYISET
jgi:formylglycine-generating enzyme required for sulfatase activity